MQERVYLSPPHMGENEIKYIQEAFDANWISPVGPNIEAFEKALVNYSGTGYAAALSSGTAAIHLALIMLGVKRGDEVICSSFTFAGSCNPIIYQGAIPIFIDAEQDTWNMDPILLEQAITDRLKKGKKPKAIILVHLYGMPAKLEEILEIADRYEIPVIEDAAEALGSKYKDRHLGTFATMGVYSFNGNKIITTSGGGALIADREDYISQARFLATQARDPAPHYEHSVVGYNYRMSNISAGIGRGQMEVLEQRVQQRRAVFAFYKEQLGDIEGISFTEEPENSFSNRWLTTILVDDDVTKVSPDDIRKELERHNIESRPLWKPMHLQPVFHHFPCYGGNVSADLFVMGLCLPSGSCLGPEILNKIVDIVKFIL